MLQGVYVANVTPFRDDVTYSVDVDAYLAHVAWLAGHGVTGVIPFGTNGEGPSVARDEKLPVLERLFARGPGIQIVPTAAEGNLPDTVALLERLNDLPATAVLVLPPYYFKPAAPEGLRVFYERVLEVSRHPVVVYHIPKYAVPVPAQLVTTLDLWGVKDSGGEAGYAEAVLASGRGVLLGTEDDLWGRLAAGADGAISALANVVPEQVVELYDCVRRGDADRGRELPTHLQRFREVTKEHASPGVLKAMAGARHGAAMGTVRPPLVPLPADYDPKPGLVAAGVV